MSNRNSQAFLPLAMARWRLIAGLCAMMGAMHAGAMERPNVIQVTVHDRGKPLVVTPASPEHANLISLCEKQLKTADNILRLAVSRQLILQLQQHEVAVEILYPSPIELTPAFRDVPVRITRLLIPLTGEYAGAVSTIFYGEGGFYSSGPYRNRLGMGELIEAVRSLGILFE